MEQDPREIAREFIEALNESVFSGHPEAIEKLRNEIYEAGKRVASAPPRSTIDIAKGALGKSNIISGVAGVIIGSAVTCVTLKVYGKYGNKSHPSKWTDRLSKDNSKIDHDNSAIR